MENSLSNRTLSRLRTPDLFSTQNESNNVVIFGYPFALFLFQALFNLADMHLKLASRLALFGGVGFCVILPNWLFRLLKGRNRKNFIWQVSLVILSCLYFYMTTLRMNYLNLMPYGILGYVVL